MGGLYYTYYTDFTTHIDIVRTRYVSFPQQIWGFLKQIWGRRFPKLFLKKIPGEENLCVPRDSSFPTLGDETKRFQTVRGGSKHGNVSQRQGLLLQKDGKAEVQKDVVRTQSRHVAA